MSADAPGLFVEVKHATVWPRGDTLENAARLLPVLNDLPVLDVDAMLRRLPAQARANVAWARKLIADGLLRLRSEPLTDALVAEVAKTLVSPMEAVGAAAWHALAANVEAYRAAAMTDFRHEEEALSAFVVEEGSRDTISWITGLLRSFYSMAISTIAPQHRAKLEEETRPSVASLPGVAPFMRGMAALMAAAEEARAGQDPQRARDLVDVAFLNFTEFRNALREQGLQLSAFPYATTEQRRELLSDAARRVREAFTTEDWSALNEARMMNLR